MQQYCGRKLRWKWVNQRHALQSIGLNFSIHLSLNLADFHCICLLLFVFNISRFVYSFWWCVFGVLNVFAMDFRFKIQNVTVTLIRVHSRCRISFSLFVNTFKLWLFERNLFSSLFFLSISWREWFFSIISKHFLPSEANKIAENK